MSKSEKMLAIIGTFAAGMQNEATEMSTDPTGGKQVQVRDSNLDLHSILMQVLSTLSLPKEKKLLEFPR